MRDLLNFPRVYVGISTNPSFPSFRHFLSKIKYLDDDRFSAFRHIRHFVSRIKDLQRHRSFGPLCRPPGRPRERLARYTVAAGTAGVAMRVEAMAGTPKRRAERERLRQQIDVMSDLLAQGLSDKAACERMGINIGSLYWVEQHDPAAADKLARARKAGAVAMTSETLDIADELTKHDTVDPVKSAMARIGVRQWLAARRNRELFGDARPQVGVSVSVAGLHLTALRTVQPADSEPVALPQQREPVALPQREPAQLPQQREPANLNDLL